MNEQALATVIVPIYKVEEYLSACVDSILAQTYHQLQIILVDDGSPDGCGAICDAYARKDTRIEVIHKPNGGLGSARNAGLDAARGKYIYFVDSDDLVKPNEIELTLAEMEKGSWDLCAWGAMTYQDDREGAPIGRNDRLELTFANEAEKSRFLCRYFLQARVRWEAWDRVFRRSIIETNSLRFGNERQIFAEDMDFSLRYLMACSNMVCLPDKLYYYRIRGTSIMQTKKWEDQCRQLANMLYYQHEHIGTKVPYGKSYLNESVIIGVFLTQSFAKQDAIQMTGRLRTLFMESEHWPYLLQEMQLAANDRSALIKASGAQYGKFLHALCCYLVDNDEKAYAHAVDRFKRSRKVYLMLRDSKNRFIDLLHGRKG